MIWNKMENSQQWPVLSYQHLRRDITPFKGVIINVTVLSGVCSRSSTFPRTKETRLAPGEQVAFNTTILDWMREREAERWGRTRPFAGGEPSGLEAQGSHSLSSYSNQALKAPCSPIPQAKPTL